MVNAQQGLGTVQGKVKEKTNPTELLPFVSIALEQNGLIKYKGESDFDGEFKIASVTPGTYNVRATVTGYKPQQINGFVVKGDKINFLDILLESAEGATLEEFEVIEYNVPLIDKDGGASGGTVTREEIAKMPGRSATSVAATVGGVYSQEGSGALSIRGSRSDALYYYIDGVKVRGSSNLPKSAVEEISVITGGLPANYGDATGGIISITTRGPSSKYFGGIEYITSGYKFGENTVGLDRYAYNLIEGTISGPLWMKKDSTGKKTKPILGFFLSGNYTNQVDSRPFRTTQYRLKDEVREELLANPLRPNVSGTGVLYNTDFLDGESFEEVKYRWDAESQNATLAGKIDVSTGPNITLTFGGQADYARYRDYDYNNMMFNSENNGLVNDLSWRAYGRFVQRFANKENTGEGGDRKKGIRNAYYSIMVDYSKNITSNYDQTHKDNYFNYGHVGKFTTYRQRSYQFNPSTGALEQNGWEDTLVTFEASEVNPDLAAITQQYYTIYANQKEDHYENMDQIKLGNALRNGDQPQSVYDVWNNIGTQYNGYGKTDATQFRITASGNADVGNHALTLGFEYEQRNDRFFNVSPVGLWFIGRLLQNSHIQELDKDNPIVNQFGTFQMIDYNQLVQTESQSFFDYNLRIAQGLDPYGQDFLDLDSYDPSTLKLDFFSADELLNSGESYVNYSGFDHTGKKTNGNASLDDFFNQKDEFGNYVRPVNAFQPIYNAVYVMDKFSFDDLIFNVGLRVDRFDANQPVLSDKYLFFPAKTVKEVGDLGEHPGNISQDAIVYVNDVNNPTAINGYREGTQWYNAEGTAISDPSLIFTPAGIAPYLANSEDASSTEGVSKEAFTDYTPQINFMPRIAFSFPISDEALFFAHYDVLTKRPTTGNRFDIFDYYYVYTRAGDNVLNNPNLKPEKTIDYELGFQQVLTKSSSLKISAFYRELRDMVTVVRLTGAYPRTYRSYDNIDFGTVKGLTLTYDLRRTKNLWMKASYTLQFAEGTGSDAGSSLNLVNTGQPNLRTIYPFSYDQRHGFNFTIDYRYGEGKDYNGPRLFGKDILANTGINIINIFGSGTPYSSWQFPAAQAFMNGNSSAPLSGQVNGSRKPGQFRMDAQVDKNIILTFGKKDGAQDGGNSDADRAKTANLNIYLWVSNVLNTNNITGVYNGTGNPDDDGYLTDARYQTAVSEKNDPESFRYYYALKMNSPFNYGLPRTIRLGVKLDF